jgi:hypothetical protein
MTDLRVESVGGPLDGTTRTVGGVSALRWAVERGGSLVTATA